MKVGDKPRFISYLFVFSEEARGFFTNNIGLVELA